MYSSFPWSSFFNMHCQWSESPNWCIFCVQVIIIAIIIMNIIIINHYERPQHHRVSLLFDFPARQVTSSRSSVLDLLLLTKAVSKNWNFVSTFNTWRLWNRLMYDLNGQRISVENFINRVNNEMFSVYDTWSSDTNEVWNIWLIAIHEHSHKSTTSNEKL